MVNRANVRVEGAGYSPTEKIRLCLCTWSLSWGGVRRGCCIVAAYRRNAGVEADGRGAEA